MDNDLADMPDIPDVPDDDEDEDLEEGAAASAVAAGPPGRLAVILSTVAGLLGPVVRPIGALLAPVGAVASPVLGRVPPMVRTAVMCGLAVVFMVVGVSTVVNGGGSPGTHAAEAHEGAGFELLQEELPTPRPRITPTPRGPTATPTPPLWNPQKDGGWIGRGYAGPSRLDMLKPERFLLFDDRRDAYTIVTRFSILTASGPGAPLWGVALSYHDEVNHVILESSVGKDRHPQFVLTAQKNGMGGPLGPVWPAPELPFWGRDTHELRVTTNQQRIKIWLDDLLVGQVENKHVADGGQKGLFAWFGAVIRVESFKIQ